MKKRFEKNKIYYSIENKWKLKFIEIDMDYYAVFKVIEHNDKKEDWEFYCTKDYDEIVKSKKDLKNMTQ